MSVIVDEFLPRACDLATSSSNRQTKVAACELVHSLVLLLLGREAEKTSEIQAKTPADKLYKKLFPVLLDLSVDVEIVSRYKRLFC